VSSLNDFINLRDSDGIAKLRKRIMHEVPQLRTIATEQQQRKIRIGGRWIADFASCNYLGMDLHQKVMDSIPPAVAKWGVHPSWTRIVCSPQIYEDLEVALARLLGAPSVLLFQTITLIHEGVIPIIARNDSVILMDKLAHRSIYEGCRLAHEAGAEFVQYDYENFEQVEKYLAQYQDKAVKLIAIDGVYSMSGDYANLLEYVRLAKKYNAIVYIDDAHGFGVIGEKPDANMPYGYKGNGLAKYFGLSYDDDNIIYVSGLSKAYSALGAFITCTEPVKELFCTASTYIFSGPCPTASLASSLACIDVNEQEGEAARAHIYRMTKRLVDAAREIGFEVDNRTYFPIVTVVVGSPKSVIAGCQILWEHSILITPAMFPARPINKGAVRFTITSANTEEEINQVITALKDIWQRVKASKHT
jgi:7-keto-8-aminopelargonate synthetase-like enzyme